jgi:hypothetical protein
MLKFQNYHILALTASSKDIIKLIKKKAYVTLNFIALPYLIRQGPTTPDIFLNATLGIWYPYAD